MIRPEDKYPNGVDAATADYNYGEPRNITVPGDGTGYPWDKDGIKDIVGFDNALLNEVGATPTGNPETAQNSQKLNALIDMESSREKQNTGLNVFPASSKRSASTSAPNNVIDVDNCNALRDAVNNKIYLTYDSATGVRNSVSGTITTIDFVAGVATIGGKSIVLELYVSASNETVGDYTDLTFDTMSDAIASNFIKEGYSIELKERAAGEQGGAMWDVVLTSSVTPDDYSIVQSTAIPTLSLVIRTKASMIANSLGVRVDNDGTVGTGTDSAAAATAALAYAEANNIELIFTGNVRLSSQVVIAYNGARVKCLPNFRFVPDEALLEPVKIGSPSEPTRMIIDAIRVVRGSTNTLTENVGIVFEEFNQSTISNLESRFSKYNYSFSPANDGCQQNTFINPQCVDGEINMRMLPSGSGFVNQNTFIGGRWFDGGTTVTHLYIDKQAGGLNSPNSNVFVNPSLEGSVGQAVWVNDGTMNVIMHPRTEGTMSVADVLFTASAQYNRVESDRIDLSVLDLSVNQNNVWNTRAGDKEETGNNNILSLHRKHTGIHTVIPTDTGVSISGITLANPCVITATAHGFSNNDPIILRNIGGMTELNDKAFIVQNVTANTFEIKDPITNYVIDSLQFTTYTSGGYATKGVPAFLLDDAGTSSGYSHVMDLYHGRDSADAISIRGVRRSDGLERWRIGCTGNAEFRLMNVDGMATYVDDAAAGAGGLSSGDFYKYNDGSRIIVCVKS